jgi:DNA-binding winged helix-turn-helix (wHTH) protein
MKAGLSDGERAMSSQISSRIRFGRHSLEPATCRLWAGEVEVRLTRKSAEVLRLLVERAGQPVSKDDLFAAVWSGTVVSDDALATYSGAAQGAR